MSDRTPARATTGGTKPRRFRSLASRMVALGVLQFVLFIGTAVAIFIAEGPRDEPRPRDHLAPEAVQRLEGLIDEPVQLQRALDELLRRRIEVSLYDAQRHLVATNVDPPLAIPERRWMLRRLQQMQAMGLMGSGAEKDARWVWAMGSDSAGSGDGSAGSGAGSAGSGDGSAGSGAGSAGSGAGSAAAGERDGPRSMVMALFVHGGRGYLVARGVHRAPGIAGPLLTVICGFVILGLGAFLTARWIVRPIERLSRTARSLGAGELAARSRLQRHDEIGELGHRFDEMADRIEGLIVTEKELLANVAHELRTPLTRIGVALDLAGEGDAEAARASLGEIAVDVAELETIVDDILMAMRFEVAAGGQLPLRRTVIEPAAIASASGDRMRARHRARPLELAVTADLPAIHVDPRLFRRVIDNLLENAHKYTPDPDARIELIVAADPAGVAFEIRDRGIGITAEDLPRIFTPFFRGDRSRSREAGGVGLGLTLAKRIVEAHGGAIEVTSEPGTGPGTGTTVRVTVPAITASET